MAHIDDGGGKRSGNVDLNIVPFIDLMSVLIIFLLISAVWTQVSMIQLGSSIYGKKTTDTDPVPPPRAEVVFRVDVKEIGYKVVLGLEQFNFPRKNMNGDFSAEELLEKLREIKEIYPEKEDVVVTMADNLEYEHLILAMDLLLKAEFPQISIAAVEVADNGN